MAHLKFHGTTLQNREVEGFALKEIQHSPGVFIPKHSHEHAHVGFILNGGFTETFTRRTLECRPLSVSYIAPGLPHTDDFRHGVRCLVMEIAPQRLERVRALLTLREPIFVHGGRAAWLTMRMYSEALQTDRASSIGIEGLALEILAELAQQQETRIEKKPPRWLEQARELLCAQFGDTLTHDTIAHVAGVHPVHLATMFRHYYHCTIGEYVRRLRIEFASRQISTSRDSLCEIGLAAGFSDQSHFSRVFKGHTGLTPGRFRANLGRPLRRRRP